MCIISYLNFKKKFCVYEVTEMTSIWSVHVQTETTQKEVIFNSQKHQRCTDLISNKFPSMRYIQIYNDQG